jgi:hypothetical protein
MFKTANETCHQSVLDRMAGWTGWFGVPRGAWSSCHPVILSALSAVFVLDPGFRAVERNGQRREPATGDLRIATRLAGWLPFAGPPWLDLFGLICRRAIHADTPPIRRKQGRIPPRAAFLRRYPSWSAEQAHHGQWVSIQLAE